MVSGRNSGSLNLLCLDLNSSLITGLFTPGVFLGFSKPKVYFTEHVKDLRTVPLPVSPYRYRRSLSETAYSGLRVGVIAFDYGSRTIRFGVSLEETDAIEVVKLIKKRFPQYRE